MRYKFNLYMILRDTFLEFIFRIKINSKNETVLADVLIDSSTFSSINNDNSNLNDYKYESLVENFIFIQTCII